MNNLARKSKGNQPRRYSDNLLDWFDRSIDSFFNDFDIAMPTSSLVTDVAEDEEKYTIRAEVPGLNQDNIDLDYDNNILTLKAKYEEKSEEGESKWLRKGQYAKSYRLPDIDIEKANANLKDGILKVELPKSEEKKPKKISIN
jgi:HSP20 family protein